MEQDRSLQNNQMEMPIKEKGEFIYNIKRNLSKSIVYAGVMPQWRNFLYVFSTISGIALTIAIGIFLYQNMQVLPEQIPLFYQQKDISFATIAKDKIFIVPGFIFLVTIVMNYLKGRIYGFDRRLVFVLNIAEIISYILIFVGLSQLFSLILI